MPRADIYRLPHSADGGVQFACRLTQKAFQQGYAVRLQIADPQRAAALDKALWDFRPDSFVPHTLSDAGAEDRPARIVVPAAVSPGSAPSDAASPGSASRDTASPDSTPSDAASPNSASRDAASPDSTPSDAVSPGPNAGEDAQAPQLLALLGGRAETAPDCERVAEILIAEDEARVAERLEFYRTQGYEVYQHSIPAS